MNGFLTDPADLSQLSHMSSGTVIALAQHLQSLSPEILNGRKSFIVIGTGGTLSMRTDEAGLRVPDMDFTAIVQRADPDVLQHFHILGLDAFKLDSAQMNYTHVADLAITMCYLWRHCADHIDGFLVLHGTDTLSDSGATLSLMLGQGLPFSVVYTAAQKPIRDAISDAPQNIRHALFTLEALRDGDMAEVVSVMGDYAYLSSSAVKIHDQSMNALAAPLHGPIATFTMLDYPIKLAAWLNPRRAHVDFQPHIWTQPYGHTLIVRSHMGLNPATVAQRIAADSVQAVLMYSYGAGTLYTPLIEAVTQAARTKNCPIFVVSPVDTSYKVMYKSAQEALDQGIVALHMTLPAALTKIEIALHLYGDDLTALADFMRTNYVGEIPPHE